MTVRARLEEALGPAYRVERELGGGGMSHTFVAEELALGRRVVVKVLPPEMAATVNAERFAREIRTLASLQHPNIVPLHTAGGQGDLLWFTMPLVEGEELRARLLRDGALPVAEAVRYWTDLLDALAYAHARGVLHRDIKPENVLVSDRHAWVADFGVSKALADAAGGRAATMTGVSIGTPAYMAPEQAMADPATDHRADLYAAGLVMYEMLAGEAPFGDRPLVQQLVAHATEAPPPLRGRRPDVSEALEALVMRCLAKAPDDRPASATELLAALEQAAPMPTPTPATGRTGAVAPSRPPRSRRRTVALVGGALLTVLGVGAVLAMRERPAGGAGPLGGPDTLAVVTFVMPPTHDAGDSLLAADAVRALAQRLRGDRRLATMTLDEMPAMMSDVEVAARAVARDTLLRWLPDFGVDAHVSLSVARAGSGHVVSVSAVGTHPDSVLFGDQVAAPTPAEIPQAVRTLAERTAKALVRLHPNPARPRATGAFWGTTPDAAERMGEGFDAFYARDYLPAAEAFRQALRLDSTLAIAALQLSWSLGNAGVRTEERLRAISLAHRHRARLRMPEMRVAMEAEYWRAVGDDARALEAYDRLEREFGAIAGRNNLGLLYERLRRFDDARRAFADVRDSTYRAPNVANGSYLRSLLDAGRFDEYDADLARLVAVAGAEHPIAFIARSNRLRADRQWDSVEVRARHGLAIATSRSVRLSRLWQLRDVLAFRGKLEEESRVRAEYLAALASDGSAGNLLGVGLAEAAVVTLTRGDTTEGARLLDAALARTDFDAVPALDRPYQNLIYALAVIGRLDAARARLAEWERVVPAEFRRLFEVGIADARGEIAMAEGDGRAAVAAIRQTDRGACVPCAWPSLGRAWDVAGVPDSALHWYEAYLDARSGRLSGIDRQFLALGYRRAGELHEARGDARAAIRRYRQYVDLLREADAALQPRVAEVRERIARLERRIG